MKKMLSLQVVLWVLLAQGAISLSQAEAGDLSIELGDSMGPLPTGAYIEQLESSSQSKSMRWALKYTFAGGLLFGREEFSSASHINDGTNKNVLLVTAKGYTIGWAMGEVLRFVVEVALPEKATVSIRDDELAVFGGSSEKSEDLDAQWFGISLDWGFMNNDGSGLGFNMMLRHLSLSNDVIFETGKDFDAGGTYFAAGFRYRF